MKNFMEFLKPKSENGANEETVTKKPTITDDYTMSELLTSYMKLTNELSAEIALTKVKLEKVLNTVSEKEIENQALKAALASDNKKMKNMEKKIVRLAAIEKVWKQTFAKLNTVPESDSFYQDFKMENE